MRYLLFLFAIGTFFGGYLPASAAPLVIASQGKSPFSIIIPEQSPTSLRAAAEELKNDIQLATNASLTIQQDNGIVATPFISLGATKQAQKAGVLQRKIPEEGFSILTRDGNLYIWGPDTPDGKFTAEGGTSNGTANGVYTFLEDYLDVRWLMPGELGLDVPQKSTFAVSAIDRTESPFFTNRRMPYIQNALPTLQKWQSHQKLGFSFRIEHGHNWTKTVTPDLYKDHPDWFAMIDGKRPAPMGDYKLETTNPELVKFFAKKAIEALKNNPNQNVFSLSPSDHAGWSQSPKSKALYDTLPDGKTSVTPLVLKFYNDVSRIVAQEYRQGKLSGYIYWDYFYPPTKGNMTLPDNFYPVIAPLINYGFRLYREDVQKDFEDILQKWSKVTSHLSYYDLPTWFDKSSGIISPAAPEILNYIFPRLVKNNVEGVYIYGSATWSQAAMGNYILAKMMWNPHLDAHEVQKEWLVRAYGPNAGAAMETFYQKLDGWFREYYQQHEKANWFLTNAIFRDVYGVHYSEMEQLFLNAKVQKMSPIQKQRLQLLEDNLIALQLRLRNMRSLQPDYQSPLTRSDAEVAQILAQKNKDFELFPDLIPIPPAQKPLNVRMGSPIGEVPFATSFRMRNDSFTLLYSADGGPITITPIVAFNSVISYTIKDEGGVLLQKGEFTKDKSILFQARAEELYFLHIDSGIYEFKVEGAAAAIKADTEGGKLHLFGVPAIMYVYIPENVENWELELSSPAPGETAKVTVFSPDGKEATVLETGVVSTQTANLKGQSGFWKIVTAQASIGIIDDYFLTFDKALPQWVSINPTQPLEIQ